MAQIEYEEYEKAAAAFPELVTAPYGPLIETIGFRAVYLLAEEYGGATIYVPKKRAIFKSCLIEQMKREYTGYNIKELARKYDYSIKGAREILKAV